ncbi:MAG: hypothetical protein JST48_12870 [Bacteroidetes bacterium]|nr:hypothetical protein [Bacteroidota bacterium]
MYTRGLAAICLITCFAANAQELKKDTVKISTDSVRLKNGKMVNIEAYVARFNPRKALFYSAILPGAGQVYNKKYWKVPFVYGGILGMVAVVKFYNDGEAKYTQQLFYNINHPTAGANPQSGFTTDQLRKIVDQTRRNRDYFMILTGFMYILQVVDAHVDAHLKEFDINPKLHVRIEPTYSPFCGIGTGLTFRF